MAIYTVKNFIIQNFNFRSLEDLSGENDSKIENEDNSTESLYYGNGELQ